MTQICSRCDHWFGSSHEDSSNSLCDNCLESLSMEKLRAENERLRELVPEAYREGWKDRIAKNWHTLQGGWFYSNTKKRLEQSE